MNSQRRLAARRAEARALHYLRKLERIADNDNPQLAFPALRTLLELVYRKREDAEHTGMPGLEYYTEAEERKLLQLISRARRRKERGHVVRTFDDFLGEQPKHPAQEFSGIPRAADVVDAEVITEARIPIPQRTEGA
jgi:hypothetical protein